MNALVVDDDYYVVTALEKKIDWKLLGIENVYTANNVAQAREILQEHPVQILISDIEMPQGSGLELLAWIREEQYAVQAIFLTNYADFNYAQKAIELQSFEYFLKPIEFDKLMLIIQKAAPGQGAAEPGKSDSGGILLAEKPGQNRRVFLAQAGELKRARARQAGGRGPGDGGAASFLPHDRSLSAGADPAVSL